MKNPGKKKSKPQIKNQIKNGSHFYPLFILLSFVGGIASLVIFFNFAYAQKFFPHIKVANIDFDGKTKNEVKIILENRINYFESHGLVLFYKEKEWPLSTQDLGVIFNLDESINSAFTFGHEKDLKTRITNQIKILFHHQNFPIIYNLSQGSLSNYLEKNLQSLVTPARSAEMVFQNGNFIITNEKEGTQIERFFLEQTIENSLENLSDNRIAIQIISEKPLITNKDLEQIKPIALEMTSRNLRLNYEKKFWTATPKIISEWLSYQKQTETTEIIIQEDSVNSFLKTAIAPDIEQEPQNARFRIEDDKIIAFEQGLEGKKIDLAESKDQIENALKNKTNDQYKQADLIVQTIAANTGKDYDLKNLGIQDLISTGESDFTGSPVNRKHNIEVGSAKLDGILIKPGEEFSIIQTLGEVSAATGYKPELVIKPEGTIPEFGGGLCQVSTTLFRAAIYAGLPIVERKAHKYVVSYYKPTGMDATIYIPHPDLRFKNDTPGHILIQKKIEGNKLSFNFYGMDDGRKIKIDGPYNTSAWINPSPAEYIETNTLPKGTQKQIEKEHKGVSTVFHRIVTRDGQEILKDSFYSKYQPWNAVFLVGTKGDVKPAATSSLKPTTTSTSNSN